MNKATYVLTEFVEGEGDMNYSCCDECYHRLQQEALHIKVIGFLTPGYMPCTECECDEEL